MKLRFIALFLIILVIGFGYLLIRDYFVAKSFEEKRQDVVSDLDLALAKAVESGDYSCCINPPCKMCYLGNWIWEDGRCDCDKEIAQGNWDNVCPECKSGIEKGTCGSVEELEKCLND